MPPAEKAKQLVHKFYFSLPNNGGFTGPCNINDRWDEGKMCATIAVDEIINSNPTSQLSDPFLGNRTYENVNYWQQVKQEINKL